MKLRNFFSKKGYRRQRHLNAQVKAYIKGRWTGRGARFGM